MMVMVAEHVHREMIAVSPEERSYLREHEKAPKYWRIWIGRHARQDHPMFTHRALTFFATKEEFERFGGETTASVLSNTQTSTICLGEHLIIHAMSSQVAWSIIRRWSHPVQIASDLTQIWPVKTPNVSWPPPAALTDLGIELLADQFFDRVTAIIRDPDRKGAI